MSALAAGIIDGTDAFCALVQRPALTTLDDATLTAVMGRIHQYGDRRLPAPGVIGILAAAVRANSREPRAESRNRRSSPAFQ
jgi:hypothetical protein